MRQWNRVDSSLASGKTIVSADVTIVRATRSHWRALRAIRLEALRDTPDAYGTTLAEAETFRNAKWRAMVTTQCYFLAQRDACTVGMISGGMNDQHPGTYWMYGMYVSPADRGSGVADRLVDTVESWAKDQGASALYLHVTSTVLRARAFYERIGFVETGDRFTMTRNVTLELLTMRKSLVDA
jgi:ribosomal protein S18 acetylase RimI-like enzyme